MSASADEATQLAVTILSVVKELEEEREDDDGFDDFKAKKKDAQKMMTQGTPSEALQAALSVLDVLMFLAKKRQAEVQARLREILWLGKDAAGLFKDMDDKRGRAVALKMQARSHLARSQEPDAPASALKTTKEALAIFRELRDRSMEADALCMVSEAHVAKASASPFENVVVEQVEAGAAASKEAENIYRDLQNTHGAAKALHCTAKALLKHTDEDEVLEGERFADDARELFHDLGDHASEVAVLMTGISARHVTSGPESALMMAKDAAEDWQQEGGRNKDTALAMLLAAGFQLELSEYEDALTLCTDAQALYDKVGDRRGVANALETRSAALFGKKMHREAVAALEEMATVFQKLGDIKAQGNALMMAANMLLNELSDEVESDTQAEYKKVEPKVGISTDDVHKRTSNGMEYANRATKCFEEIGDEDGIQAVKDLIQNMYNRAIRIYCDTNEPDQIYYTLSSDSPLEDASKCIKEWKIPMPSFQKTEGLDKSDGYLHIYDPHPPPKM